MAGSAAGGAKEKEGFFRRTFGPAGPLALSTFWTLVIAVMVWALIFAASFVDIPGMEEMLSFFRDGILYIFLFILFLSYATYFMEKERRFLIALLPAACSAGLLAALWIAGGTLHFMQNDMAVAASAYAWQLIFAGPVMVLSAGYAIVITLFLFKRPLFLPSPARPAAAAVQPAQPARAEAPAQVDYEGRMRELRGMMREAEKKYLNRQIDRKTFDKIAKDYHQSMAELEGKRKASAG
jgi:hypothetical protein